MKKCKGEKMQLKLGDIVDNEKSRIPAVQKNLKLQGSELIISSDVKAAAGKL